jgi:hypothetical protein
LRILITITPRMYREALALVVHRRRPDLEVRLAPPENVIEEVRNFAPHLLVRNDNDGIDSNVLAGVPCWVGVRYTDSMDVRINLDGSTEEVSDMAMDGLLAVVEKAEQMILRD